MRTLSSDEICPRNECFSSPVHWVVMALGLQGEEKERWDITQLEDSSVDQLGRQFIYKL